MTWTPIPSDEARVMAETIGSTTFSYLHGWEALQAVHVLFYYESAKATVSVVLHDNTLDGQLTAITDFADVRECYADELQLELRFGDPVADTATASSPARTALLTR